MLPVAESTFFFLASSELHIESLFSFLAQRVLTIKVNLTEKNQ